MDLARAVQDVLLGASLRDVAAEFRQDLLAAFHFRPEETTPETFRGETAAFMRKLARHLGDRHAGEPRVGQALRDWVMVCDHYEAWDALLSGFQVDGREALVRRGKVLFPGPLTAHWAEP
ncbi:MAG: hypothetical protein FJ265_20215 [Planctomycetes bacterium]|nr:hypothetical protein [Planctomycetota bacterium]